MRLAIYARYSSDLQNDRSIEDQLALCRAHAERAGGIDAVLAEALDRISRDQEDTAAIYKRLAFAGVKLLTVAEGEVNELHVGFKGTMNALFLKDLAAKIRRGQRGTLAAGRSPGGRSYGYRVVRRLDERGELVRGEREIEPAEAEVVRRIFAEFAAGRSPRAIAAALNAEGVPSPAGKRWNASTINGHRARRNGILWNEAYIGRIVYNRLRMLRDPDSGRRLSRANAGEDWQRVEARAAALERQLAPAARENVIDFHPGLPEIYRRKVAALEDAVAAGARGDAARAAVRELIDAVVVVPAAGRGDYALKLRGNIEAVLALAGGDGFTPSGVSSGSGGARSPLTPLPPFEVAV